MIRYKFLVVKFFIHNHIEHAQGQSRIGTRPELQPDIGPGGDACKSRINGNQLCAGIQADGKRLALVTVRVADYQVVAPHHNALWMVFVVDNGVCPAGDDTGGNTGAVAKVTGRQHIRSSQQIGKAVNDRLVFPAGTVTQYNGFRTEPGFVIQNAFGNGIQCFIPGNTLPFTTALGSDSAQRIGQPIRVVCQLGRGKSFAAKRAMVDRTGRIAGDFGHFPVFSVDQNPATAMAHAAVAFDNGIVTVNFHFAFSIGKFEFRHLWFP